MKTIQHIKTLFYYDGPQVFEARDAIGGHYVAVMTEADHQGERYLVAGVKPESLRLFRSGSMDLRTLLTEQEGQEWYLTRVGESLEDALPLESLNTSISDSRLLPEPGFFLHDLPATEAVLVEARVRNNVVLDISVEPPEATVEHRIRLETLVELLAHIQTIVKHAYSSAVRDLSQATRRQLDRSHAHLLDVFVPAAPGSFRVMMEATKSPDPQGQSEMVRALEKVDLLLANTANPTQAISVIKNHKGHLAGAYLRLLKFLAESRTGLRYSWASPASSAIRGQTLQESDVGTLLNLLSGVSNLNAEPMDLIGRLDKADVSNKAWRLVCEDDAYSGKVKDGGVSLEGLQTGARYKFHCIEEIESAEGTGREARQLYLVEYEPA